MHTRCTWHDAPVSVAVRHRHCVCVCVYSTGLPPPPHVPHEARPAELRYALTNSFGFGGTNGAIIMAAPDVA